MRFVVEIDAGMEKANAIDASGGPGAMLAKLGERFKPEAVYGKASLRGAYIVVDLKSPADISELMYALTWGTGGEPKFTPILTENFDEIIGRAKSLVSPKD
jgi:hypothetical protein